MDSYSFGCLEGHTKIVKLLAPKAENPNAPGPDGQTALDLALRFNHIETVGAFLKILTEKFKTNPQAIMESLKRH